MNPETYNITASGAREEREGAVGAHVSLEKALPYIRDEVDRMAALRVRDTLREGADPNLLAPFMLDLVEADALNHPRDAEDEGDVERDLRAVLSSFLKAARNDGRRILDAVHLLPDDRVAELAGALHVEVRPFVEERISQAEESVQTLRAMGDTLSRGMMEWYPAVSAAADALRQGGPWDSRKESALLAALRDIHAHAELSAAMRQASRLPRMLPKAAGEAFIHDVGNMITPLMISMNMLERIAAGCAKAESISPEDREDAAQIVPEIETLFPACAYVICDTIPESLWAAKKEYWELAEALPPESDAVRNRVAVLSTKERHDPLPLRLPFLRSALEGMIKTNVEGRPLAGRVHIRWFEASLPPEDDEIPADPGPIVNGVLNMVRNASRQSVGAGRIDVRVECDAVRGELVVSVEDDGSGIPASLLPAEHELEGELPPIFHSGVSESGSSGLGLRNLPRRIGEGIVFSVATRARAGETAPRMRRYGSKEKDDVPPPALLKEDSGVSTVFEYRIPLPTHREPARTGAAA